MAAEQKMSGMNFDAWVKALSLEDPNLADKLNDDKLGGLNSVESLGLPGYRRLVAPLSVLVRGELDLEQLGSRRYYIVFSPQVPSLPRFSKTELTTETLPDFINTNVPIEDRGNYTVSVQQFFDNIYGGNIVIDQTGGILAEFIEGKQSPVAFGTKTPTHFVKRDRFTQTFKYSFSDLNLRRAIFNTLRCIPHQQSGSSFRDLSFLPGYYEFTLVRKDGEEDLSPIFIDYKDNPFWYSGFDLS